MKVLKSGFIVITLFFGISSLSAAEIAGTWEGTLEVAPGNKLDVQFIIEEKADGTIAVVLNSPESGAIKNVNANSASYSDNILKVEVAELSGAFEGALENNSISGQWSQVDQKFPLILNPFAEKLLNEETIALISGRWQGIFEPPGQQVNVALTIEESEPGKVRATFEQLDAGAKLVLQDFKVEGATISFRVGPNGPKYTGEVSGDDIKGNIDGGGTQFAGNLSRKAFNPRDFALDLTSEEKTLLIGQWHGEMTTPIGPVAAVFRFVEEEPNFIRGYFDSPDRGLIGLPINETTLEGEKINFAMGGNRGFSGTVVEGTLEGDYSQQGQKLPVTLKKGPLPALSLDLATSTEAKLLGNWQGTLKTPQGEIKLGIRFEKEADGSIVGYIDSPDQGSKGARIHFASFEEDKLTIKSSSLLGVEYTSTVDSSSMKGKFSQGPLNLDLNLAKVAN